MALAIRLLQSTINLLKLNIVLIKTNSKTRPCHFCFYFSSHHTSLSSTAFSFTIFNDMIILATGIFGLMNQTDYSPLFINHLYVRKQLNFYNFTIKMYIICTDFFSSLYLHRMYKCTLRFFKIYSL